MRQKGRIKKGHVGGIGEERLLGRGIVRHGTRRANPHIVERRAWLAMEPIVDHHWPHLDRPGPAYPFPRLGRHLIEKLGAMRMLVLERFRIGHLRHVELVLETLFLQLE